MTEEQIKQMCSDEISLALKDLLDVGFLYRKVEVNLDRVRKAIQSADYSSIRERTLGSGMMGGNASPIDPEIAVRRHIKSQLDAVAKVEDGLWKFLVDGFGDSKGAAYLDYPTMQRTCMHTGCPSPSPHKAQLSTLTVDAFKGKDMHGQCVQLWSVEYQCQSCEREPVVLLIRRAGKSLKLSGSSLMGKIKVPKELPEPLHKLFSDALLSRGTGMYVSACAYLRLVVETHIRTAIGERRRLKGEDLIRDYGERLDATFPPRYKWTKALWEELSVGLHSGVVDQIKLDRAFEAVTGHFEQLRLIPIPAKKIPKKRLTK